MDWDEHRNLILEVILGVVVLILLVIVFVSTTGGGKADNASSTDSTTTTTVAEEETSTTTSTQKATTTTAPKSTIVGIFAPWKADGSGVAKQVKTRATGECFAESALVSTAYRCFIGNEIQDPCFADPAGTNTLACATDPWADVTVLTMTGKLPETSSNGKFESRWAIELENGDRCTGITGTVSSVDGVAMPYVCKSGGSAGEVSEATQPWTVMYRDDANPSDLQSQKVTTVW